jgi:hypothetical protein
MDKNQAIDIVKQLANVFRGTLQEHQVIRQAIVFIEANLTEPKKASSESKDDGQKVKGK